MQVHTDAGLTGLGETFYAPTVVQAAVHDHFGPLLIGRDPFEVERHWEAMFRLSDHAGYGGAEMRAISALDVALWDIKGQAVGVPVYGLLGGAVRRRIRVYATGMPYEGAAELARRLLGEGITAMKGGPTIPLAQASDGQYLSARDLDRALKPFREIRDAVGPDMELANDGHGKWALPVAIRIAQAMEPLEPLWQEDLMPLLNPAALRRLQEATRTPVCVSERLLTRWQHRQYIENGAARIVMPDLIWTGGVSETHKVAILASAHQVPLAPHDATGPVNIFACAQVCMSAPNVMLQEHVPAFHRGWYADFVEPNLEIRAATCTRRSARGSARGSSRGCATGRTPWWWRATRRARVHRPLGGLPGPQRGDAGRGGPPAPRAWAPHRRRRLTWPTAGRAHSGRPACAPVCLRFRASGDVRGPAETGSRQEGPRRAPASRAWPAARRSRPRLWSRKRRGARVALEQLGGLESMKAR